jgi:hypothetical protein
MAKYKVETDQGTFEVETEESTGNQMLFTGSHLQNR